MGSVMSLNCSSRSRTPILNEGSSNESCKRQKICSSYEGENNRLIPRLPDELSIQILARVPRICYFNARLVSRKWKSAFTSSELYCLRQELGKTEEWLYVLTKDQENVFLWHALDPVSAKWQRLPPMPDIVCEEESRRSFSGLWNVVSPRMKVAEILRSWFGRKDRPEKLPFCGCAFGAVDGCLYVLGGLSKSCTANSVLRFDPVLNKWNEVSPMLESRAYSKTGILNNKLYVVGGINHGRGGFSPLRSAEVYDPSANAWSEVPSMPFSKAQVLPNAFLAGLLKPVATGMSSYNGRLCVPQSLYSWPFYVDIGGEVYEPETNSWIEMPIGMGEGWPARQAGTKLSVVVDGELYGFDPPPSSMESGNIKVYDQKEDTWKVVIREVPVSDLPQSESPYILAGFHGKLHFITRDFNGKITVLRADLRESSSSPSSGPYPFAGSRSFREKTDLPNTTDTVVWKVIAAKDFGAAELVSCQVIDL
ncbi:PREDICTED: F-box/kelch-repeat protein At1g22040-like [Tarenaya hassleriana]|uniref:F-box/kelch-repeat protein At1g22040-like n=1 Tax=Tarenaya hassleriana TaxID=28532 RepID=UPI00053C9EEF|nr:PREDICTED: F-box/kelch-repeat protein At1g22040-like [Tarenaya hassleriana]XP_010541376.1 PREDICTED: F-box/kelch-repeat protein At1g22040-like [Tarenaya hassleriana]